MSAARFCLKSGDTNKMSRIGKQTIALPEETAVKVGDDVVTVTGPLGILTRHFDPRLEVVVAERAVSLRPRKLNLETNALWGTYASHLRNMVRGVTAGFSKELVIEGVGYRVNLAGPKLIFALGFSHPVELAVPEGVKIAVDKNTLTISGRDKELVGQFTARIRKLKPPEPYKGKGIRYADETIRRKVGKKVTAAA